MTYRLILLVLIFTGFVLTGCSSTSITGSWKSPEFNRQLNKIYIVGISKSETTRRIFEDGFQSKLQSFGVTGITSYRDLPVSEETQEAMIKDKVAASGAEALLMTRAIGKRTEEVVTPGRAISYDYGPRYYGRGGYYPTPYYHNYGSYYSRSWETTYEPATVTQFEIVTIEANIFDVKTDELIWSAQLETVIENNMDKLISDFIEAVIKDLQSQGLI